MKWTFESLYHFERGNPFGELAVDEFGTIYGAVQDITVGCGYIYQLSNTSGSWQREKLKIVESCPGGVILGPDGSLYGTSGARGNADASVFRLSPPVNGDDKWTFEELMNFANALDSGPFATPIFDDEGALWGTTRWGTSVWRIIP